MRTSRIASCSCLVVLLHLAGCVTPIPPFEGTTLAGSELRADIYEMTLLMVPCFDIERVETRLVEEPTGERPVSLKWMEEWTLYGCEHAVTFDIDLTGDGAGGTVISLERKPDHVQP